MRSSNISQDSVVDFRAACTSPAREKTLPAELGRLRTILADSESVEIVWPTDRDLPIAGRAFGCPLAHAVLAATAEGSAGPHQSCVTIHTRNSALTDFLSLSPVSEVRFVFHLNGEEAAMRWERHDAAPKRRILAATRLLQAGWQVSFVLGPLRPYRGCREDYAEVLAAVPRNDGAEVTFSLPEDDLMERHISRQSGTGRHVALEVRVPLARRSFEPRLRRELGRLLASRLPAAA
jgi:hypothetical protein